MKIIEEESWWQRGFHAIAGVDEAGRGPLAGPLVAAAVVFDQSADLKVLLSAVRDSKQLTPRAREQLFPQICKAAVAWSSASVSVREIDTLGMTRATKLVMARAVRKLSVRPDMLLTDAVSLDLRDVPQRAIVHGDATVFSIAAASVIAKVVRDRLMLRYSKRYPLFSFAVHKGYGTRLHMRELKANGPSPLHRRSFEPVAKLLHHI